MLGDNLGDLLLSSPLGARAESEAGTRTTASGSESPPVGAGSQDVLGLAPEGAGGPRQGHDALDLFPNRLATQARSNCKKLAAGTV